MKKSSLTTFVVKKLLLTALVASPALISTAHAGAITSFTALPTFNAAIGAATVTVENFTPTTHFPISTGILNSSTNLPGIGIVPGTIQPGVTYSTPVGNGSFFNIDGSGGFTGGFLDTVTGGNRVLTITFDSPATFFGFDTNTLVSSMGMAINFASGPAFLATITPTSGTPSFFGFVSTATDITSLTLSGPGTFSFALDNFRFGEGSGVAASVPVPGTLLLLGAGLAALFGSRRRSSGESARH
jgi:PEP-CTERM motif